MANAIIIRTDGTVELIEVTLRYPGLNSLFGEGSLVERVALPRLTDKFGTEDPYPVMVVDEESLLKDLPRNENATRLYVPAPYRDRHMIAGDALIVGEGMTSEGPDFVTLPERVTVEAIEALIETFEYH